LAFAPFATPMVFCFAPSWWGNKAYGNTDLTLAFFHKILGKLVGRIFLKAQGLATSSSSIPFSQHDPPTHKHLLHNFAFRHVGEYFQATRALAPFSSSSTSFNTTSTFITLHPEADGYFVFFP
jgi:hypothetical protein